MNKLAKCLRCGKWCKFNIISEQICNDCKLCKHRDYGYWFCNIHMEDCRNHPNGCTKGERE